MPEGVPGPKEAHVGVAAGPFGPHVYLIHDYTGKMVNVEPTRHAARGWIAKLGRRSRSVKADWFDVRRVQVGEVPMEDVSWTELPEFDADKRWREAEQEVKGDA